MDVVAFVIGFAFYVVGSWASRKADRDFWDHVICKVFEVAGVMVMTLAVMSQVGLGV